MAEEVQRHGYSSNASYQVKQPGDRQRHSIGKEQAKEE
jgi:hypothetical protein